MSSSGTWQGKSGFGGIFGYGEEDTGLEHVGHRYYDPSTGRFLTRDPAKDGPNWYAYCLGDPVNSQDQSGLNKYVIAYGPNSFEGVGTLFLPIIMPWDEQVVLYSPTKKKLLEELETADGFWYWGHGGYGYFQVGDGSFYTSDVQTLGARRVRAGKDRTEWVELRSCERCQSKEWINTWLDSTRVLHGYTEWTVEGIDPSDMHRYDQALTVTKRAELGTNQRK